MYKNVKICHAFKGFVLTLKDQSHMKINEAILFQPIQSLRKFKGVIDVQMGLSKLC